MMAMLIIKANNISTKKEGMGMIIIITIIIIFINTDPRRLR